MKKIFFETIDSTNTWAKRNIVELGDKTLVIANHQSAGKGRFERKWVSESAENLYLSFVLKPEKTDCAPNLTQYLSVVLIRVLKKYGIDPKIKWSNDILVEGKKICGILCESAVRGSVRNGFVLGVGVNLNMTHADVEKIDIPAVSLNLLTGKSVDKDEFLEFLVDEFFNGYEEFLDKGFFSIKEEYLAHLLYLGEKITIFDGTKRDEYTALDINDKGELVVSDSDGEQKVILSGDVNR